jgi:hypothetical protein
MKICNTCKIEKEYSEFCRCNNRKASPDGYQYKCKACAKEWLNSNRHKVNEYSKKSCKKLYYKNPGKRLKLQKDYYESKKDGLYRVYLVVKDNYVGTTANLFYRKYGHKHDLHLDTSEYKILGIFSTLEEALFLENSYHNRGYNGALSTIEKNKLKKYLMFSET